MKNKPAFILLLCLLFTFSRTNAQTKAITDNGDEVILYENHTWKYTDDFKRQESIIKSNGATFTKNKDATFLLKSNNIPMGFWLDPKVWSFEKAKTNLSAEYEIQQKNASMQAIIITEKVYLPIETLRNVVITNARQVAADYEVEKEEFRMVNGLKVLYIQSRGTVLDMKFIFYGYYYTDSATTLQYLCTGFAANEQEDQKVAEDLMNGLIRIQPGSKEAAIAMDTEDTSSEGQGLYSVNHDCKRFFAGKWRYKAANQNVYVERTLDKTTEYIGKYTFDYENDWISDCEYEMVFKKTTMPDYSLEKPGEKLLVKIMNIDGDVMRYIATFRGRDIEGEMSRDDNGKKDN
jgi:hypothetical protein